MDPQTANPYDVIPYLSRSYGQSSPHRIGAVATLRGMAPAPPERCRVLELGCSAGGNLIPMAYELPDSEFAGIDLAAQPIQRGQDMIAALGLTNVRLQQMNLMDVGPDFGQFDYIIAHGVYSWVSPPVQDKLLRVCQANLNPQGVAFVSYNVYPGCFLRRVFRDMMLFHIRRFSEPEEQIAQARAFLDLAAKAHTETGAGEHWAEWEIRNILKRPPALLFHDDLEEYFCPVYFTQFIEHASRHGLQYVNDAIPFHPDSGGLTRQALDAIEGARENVAVYEQYLDFLMIRRFRHSLLCHRDVPLGRADQLDRVTGMWAYAACKPAEDQQGLEPGVEAFVGPGGKKASTNDPLVIGLLRHLSGAWPRSERISDVARILGREPEDVARVLIPLTAGGLADVRSIAGLASPAGERPRASALVRLCVRQGERQFSNLYHHMVEVEDEAQRRFLGLLDGTRDRAALTEELMTLTPEKPPAECSQQTDLWLQELERLAVLEA